MARITFIILLFSFSWGFNQTEITWETLTDVTFEDRYFEEEDAYFYFPTFGSTLMALQGKEVSITGFVLALNPEQGFYILSRHPYASCFFCGSGGPDSIIELRFKSDNVKFTMDEIVSVKGILRLNSSDPNECNFILDKAEVFVQ